MRNELEKLQEIPRMILCMHAGRQTNRQTDTHAYRQKDGGGGGWGERELIS